MPRSPTILQTGGAQAQHRTAPHIPEGTDFYAARCSAVTVSSSNGLIAFLNIHPPQPFTPFESSTVTSAEHKYSDPNDYSQRLQIRHRAGAGNAPLLLDSSEGDSIDFVQQSQRLPFRRNP
ncbi:hypothetical protein HYFRA_00011508 [Hymenoscyphus fraxineus]|uniref:Uncharacterized protein n=1 Tax=Hymenoscyphus fraxineus TaxID=746836 RepID=A0A9N9L6Y9_9HELO|nr:hypothetical protein HYFRA_00011508 [Hymenoscyphus fraxineus]